MTEGLRPALSLGWREIVRFHRDRARVLSGIATAVLFWVLIGFGMGRSFAPAGMPAAVGAVEYLFPGTIVFVVLVTAIVGTFSLIEDRRSGFLQGVIVAPVPRSSIVLGKVLGGASIAVLQGAVLLPLVPLVDIPARWTGILAGVVALFAMKLAPSFIEYRSARNAIEAIAAQNPASPADVRRAFDARSAIDDINSVKPRDLDISRDGNQIVISFAYRKEIPLWKDVVGLYINYAARAGGQ